MFYIESSLLMSECLLEWVSDRELTENEEIKDAYKMRSFIYSAVISWYQNMVFDIANLK